MQNKCEELKKYLKPGKRVHLIGIGGVSMRPLGLVLQGMGLTVTGSDMNSSVSTDELIAKGIQVYIGDETPVQTMKDCSVVTASYDLGDGMKGTIGIIGPKRMDYENVVDNLKTLKVQLDSIFKKT